MECIRDLADQKDFQLADLTGYLQKIENEIIDDSNSGAFEKESIFISDLFAIAGKTDINMSQERWDIFRFNIYVFIAAHVPRNDQIPVLPFDTTYGPLFFVLTLLSSMRMSIPPAEANLITACFKNLTESFYVEETSPYIFYNRSYATYTFLLPSLMKSVGGNSRNLMIELFETIRSRYEAEKSRADQNPKDRSIISPSVQINFHTHSFFLELLKNIKEHQGEFIKAGLTMVRALRFNSNSSSAILPLYFAFICQFFCKDKTAISDDIEYIAELFEKNARLRVNDIYKSFMPQYIFQFYDKQEKPKAIHQTLRFICQILYAPNQQELISKLNKSEAGSNLAFSMRFIDRLVRGIKDNCRFPLYYFIEQLTSSFGLLTTTLRQIKAIKIGSYARKFISFSQQSNDLSINEIDKILYSRNEFESYETLEEAKKAHEKTVKYVEYCGKRYDLPFYFFLKLLAQFDPTESAFNELNESQISSYAVFYLKRIFHTFFKFLIEAFYRLMLFNQFYSSELVTQTSTPFMKSSRFESSLFKIMKNLGDLIQRPSETKQILYAKIMAACIYKSTKKRQITYFFLNKLKEYLTLPLNHTLVSQMLQISFMRTQVIDSLDYDKANNFHQYLLMILRIGGRSGPHVPPMSNFSYLLRQYQKIFMNILFSRVRASNQREYLQVMVTYIRVMLDNADNEQKMRYRDTKFKQHIKPQRQHMCDHRPEYRRLAAPLFLDNAVFDLPKTITMILQYIGYALLTERQDLITKTLDITFQFMLNETDLDIMRSKELYYFDYEADQHKSFNLLFKAIRKCSNDDAIRIIQSIPKLLRIFHSFRPNLSLQPIGYILPNYQVDLAHLLKNTITNHTGTESEAVHIIMLLTNLIKKTENLTELPFSILEQLISNMTALFVHKSIRDRLFSLFKHTHKLFAPIVSAGKYDYFFAMINNVQSSYSETSSLFINVIKSFIEDLKITVQDATNIIDTFLQSYRVPNICGMLALLSLLQDNFPGCIINSHMFTYLLILSQNSIPNTSPRLYTKPFNKFLKYFFRYLQPDQQTIFINQISYYFVRTKSLNFNIRRSLIMRMYEANTPSPFKNYNHLSQIDVKDTFYSSFAATLACGVQEDVPIPRDIIERSATEIKNIDQNNQAISMEYILRICFIRIVFLTQPPNSPFFEEKLISNFTRLLIVSSQIHILFKVVKKCFKILEERCPQCYNNIVNQFENNISSQPKEMFLLHNSRVFPQIFKSAHLKNFLTMMIEKSSDKRFERVNVFLQYSGCFRFPDFTIDEFRQVVLSEYKDRRSYLAWFLHALFLIFIDPQYPTSYLLFDNAKLLCDNFKDETITCIMNHPHTEEVEAAYQFLYDLIIDDKTDEFFKLFLAKFDNPDALDKFHPSFFRILNRLSHRKRFAELQDFRSEILKVFMKLMCAKKDISDNDYTHLNSTISAVIELGRSKPDFGLIVGLAKSFQPWQIYSPLYRKFKKCIFEGRERSFYSEMFISTITKERHRIKMYKATEIILVQLIKGMGIFTDEENATFFEQARSMFLNPEQIVCAMGCFVAYFKKNKPSNQSVPLVLSAFGPALIQPEPYGIIHVFKIANMLLSQDMLPIPVLSQLVQQVLLFFKLLEVPYTQYVTPLLMKADEKFKDSIPDDLTDMFKFTISNRIARCKELDKASNLITLMPNLEKAMPYSMIYSTIHNIDLCSHNMRDGVFSPDDHINVMSFILKISPKIKMSETVEQYFFKFCFNDLKLILIDDGYHPKNLSEYLLLLLMKKGKYMTEDLIKIAEEKESSIKDQNKALMRTFYNMFAILTVDSVDFKFISQHLNFIKDAFCKLTDMLLEGKASFKQCIMMFVQGIFNRPELLNNHFLPSAFFDTLNKAKESPKGIEYCLDLLLIYVNNTKHQGRLTALMNIWNRIEETKALFLPVAQTKLSKCIDQLPFDQQLTFLNFILKKTKRSAMIQIPLSIITSEQIANSVKLEFLNRLPKILPKLDVVFIDKLYRSLPNLKFETTQSQILLLFNLIMKSPDTSRLAQLDEMKKIAGETEEIRFMTLSTTIPACCWNNSALIFLALIIIESSPMDKPLTMIAEMFSSMSAEFMTPILTRIISESTLKNLHDLLTSCLTQKDLDDYSNVISAITTALHHRNIPISQKLLYKTTKVTSNFHLFSFDEDEEIADKLLLPHKLNDQIFGALLRNHQNSYETIAASAQFFLSNYEEAQKVFDTIPIQENSLTERLSAISNDIMAKSTSFTIFERIGHGDSLLIPELEKAYQFSESETDAESPLSQAEKCNVLYFKRHLHLSIYEKERISSVETIIQALRSKPNPLKIQPFIFESCLPPHLAKFVTVFTQKVAGTLNTPIFTGGETHVIFSPEFRSFFADISSIDSHGFFGVKWSAIDQAMHFQMNNNILWASFFFNLFVASERLPGTLYKPALKSYINILRSSILPAMYNSGFAARILTLFGLSLDSQNNLLPIANELCGDIVPKTISQHLKIWMPQVVDIRSSSPRFMEITSDFDLFASYAATLHAHGKQPRPQLGSKVAYFDKLMNIANCMFNIDKRHFENGENMHTICPDELEPQEKVSYDTFNAILTQLNISGNCEFDMRFCTPMKINIFRCHPNFTRISENKITFTCSTGQSSHQRFIIERVDRTDVAVTYSNVLESIKNVLKYNYSSRIRRIRLPSQIAIEIGPRLVMYTVPYELITVPYNLQEIIISKHTPKDYFKIRKAMISSFAAYSVVRNMFSLNQPKPEDLYISISSAEFPIFCGEYKIPERFGETASRITDGIEKFFGPTMDGELLLSISAASMSLNHHIDSIRSFIEMPIIDVFEQREKNMDVILQKRDWIERALLFLAPPHSEGAAPEDSVLWIRNVERFIANSKNDFERILFDEQDTIVPCSVIVYNNAPVTNLDSENELNSLNDLEENVNNEYENQNQNDEWF